MSVLMLSDMDYSVLAAFLRSRPQLVGGMSAEEVVSQLYDANRIAFEKRYGDHSNGAPVELQSVEKASAADVIEIIERYRYNVLPDPGSDVGRWIDDIQAAAT